MSEIISFSISRKLKNRIDLLRGDIPRSKFIIRSVESHIEDIRRFNGIKENSHNGNSGQTETIKNISGEY